jgi:hypothetical protein
MRAFRELWVYMFAVGFSAALTSIGMTLWKEFRLWEVAHAVSLWWKFWWYWFS